MFVRICLFALSLGFVSSTAIAADKIFDPASDPAKDLVVAEQTAAREHKNILLDVGGNWCGWCMLLDRTTHNEASLHTALEAQFVVLHVNWSPENPNEAFLRHYPKVDGYPHFFVLTANGKLLKSQSTDYFETDHTLAHGYNVEKLQRFLQQWSAAGAA